MQVYAKQINIQFNQKKSTLQSKLVILTLNCGLYDTEVNVQRVSVLCDVA